MLNPLAQNSVRIFVFCSILVDSMIYFFWSYISALQYRFLTGNFPRKLKQW